MSAGEQATWRDLAPMLAAHRRAVGDAAHLAVLLRYVEVAVREGQDGSSPGRNVVDDDDGPMRRLLLTLDEAAAVLAVSESTVKRLVASGELPTVTVGDRSRRVRRDDLETYVEHLAQPTADRGATA